MAAVNDLHIPKQYREFVAAEFWRWYGAHRERELTTIRVWIIRKTIRVKDVRPLFEMLFGPAVP